MALGGLKSTARLFTTAVVVPVYRQSQYLCQAVESALTDTQSQVFITNDGCPQEQTRLLIKALVLAHSGRVYSQETPNCGLSAARNNAIRLALALNPRLEFVFPLDADNVLSIRSLDMLRRALGESPNASWAYSDILPFGLRSTLWHTPQFSRIRQIYQNQCDAGSLIRASVFREGHYFDEEMRIGYEDWEFFLRLTLSGRTGTHAGDVGFRYRVKPVSMLTEVNKMTEQVIQRMHRKNHVQQAHETLLGLENADRPRFLFCNTADGRWRLTTHMNTDFVDPDLDGSTAGASYYLMHAPRAIEVLERLGLLSGVLLALQQRSSGNRTVGLTIQLASDHNEISLAPLAPSCNVELEGSLSILMLPQSRILSGRAPSGFEAGLKVCIGAEHLGHDLTSCATSGRLCIGTGGGYRPVFPKVNDAQPIGDLTEFINRIPWVSKRKSALSITFTVPWIGLGGVDTCVLALAHELAKQAINVHLVVTERMSICNIRKRMECFSTISWVIPGQDQALRMRDFIGAISHVDIVVNAHSNLCYDVFAQYRTRLYQQHFAYLHVLDVSSTGAPAGFPIVAAQHAGSVDVYLPISTQMRDILESLDVPRERIVIVPNAPIIEHVAPSRIARTLEIGPIRVLYAGRLNHQKGADILAEVIASVPQSYAVFRVIGDYVLDDGCSISPHHRRSVVDAVREPATHDLTKLKGVYEWADIVLNLTRWEGVPLSVLDAMAAGCVVLATDVGAVHEIIEHEDTGFLIPVGTDEQIAMKARAIIIHLSENKKEVDRVRRNAWASVQSRTWSKSAKRLKDAAIYATVR